MPFVSLRDKRESELGASTFQEESTFGETFGAAFSQVVNEEMSISSMLNVDNYNDRKAKVKSLVDEGTIDRKKYENYLGEFDYDRIAEDTGLIKNDLTLFTERNELLEKKRNESADVIARGSGLAQFGGSMTGYVLDPVSIATMPIATAGTTLKGLSVLAKALKVGRNEAALGMATELFIQPLVYDHKNAIDSPYGAEDAITAIVTAGIGAGILGGTIGGLQGYFKSVRQKTSPLVSKPVDDVEVGLDVNAPKRADTASEEADKVFDELTEEMDQLSREVDARDRQWDEDNGTPVKRSNTQEDEALEVLARMEDNLAALKTPRATDIEVAEYSKFKQGDYTDLAEAKTASIKGLEGALRAYDKKEPSLARWIADNGGLNIERWKREGIDPADMKLAGGFGKPVFKKTGGIDPDMLAERLFEIRRIPEFDSNVALDMVQEMVMNPKMKFNPEADDYAKGLNDRIARLAATDNDLLEESFHGAIKLDVEADGDIMRGLDQREKDYNQSTRTWDEYNQPEIETSSPNAAVTSRQSEILSDSGLNKNYDDDMAAYNSLEDKRVYTDDGELVDGAQFMKAIDDEIEGIESVMRCAIG